MLTLLSALALAGEAFVIKDEDAVDLSEVELRLDVAHRATLSEVGVVGSLAFAL